MDLARHTSLSNHRLHRRTCTDAHTSPIWMANKIVSQMEQNSPPTYTVSELVKLLWDHRLPPGSTVKGNPISWGVGWKALKASPDTYNEFPRLKGAVMDAARDTVGPRMADEWPDAQCILDYKDMYWVLNFEYYDSEGMVDNDYSMMMQLHTLEVKDLLEDLAKQGIELYTLKGPIVLVSSTKMDE